MMSSTAKTAMLDQLLAELRAAPGPLTGRELAELLPQYWVHPDPPRDGFWCHGPGTLDLYPALVKLEKQGLCARVPGPNHRSRLTWVWAGESAAAEIAALEAMLEAVR
jgi:hypothetical protein